MERKSSRFAAIIFTVFVLIGVVGCAKPKVQLQVSRDRLQQGEDVRVSWTSKDAKAVVLNGKPVDKTAQVAVAEPGKPSVKQQVAKKRHLGLLQPDHDVAVAMRRAPIVQMQGVVGKMKAEVVGERLGRRRDRHAVVVRQADALETRPARDRFPARDRTGSARTAF